MRVFKQLGGFILSAFAPFFAVIIGSAIAGLGLSMNSMIVAGAGGVLVVVGIVWGILSYCELDLF